jgi:hypothetical protein
MDIFASPLNPQTVFFSLQASGITCSNSGATASRAFTLLAGTYCELQFVSTNGGVSWSALHLPAAGILGLVSAPNQTLPVEGDLRAQGSRLYGIVTSNYTIGAQYSPPAGRLVASDDGGVTWRLADAGLYAKGYSVYDFAATPTGASIYVTAEPSNEQLVQNPQGEGAGYVRSLSAWFSPDGGQSWHAVGQLPDNVPGSGGSVTAYMSAGLSGGQAVGYFEVMDTGQSPYYLHMLGIDDTSDIWMRERTLNYTANSNKGIFELLGALPDGSVIILQPAGQGSVLGWLAGDTTRQIAQNPQLYNVSNPVLQQRADGEYLWLAGSSDSGNDNKVVEYVKLAS